MTTGSVGFDAGFGAGFATGFGFAGAGVGSVASAAGAGFLLSVSPLLESSLADSWSAGVGTEAVAFGSGVEVGGGVVVSVAGGFASVMEGCEAASLGVAGCG